MNLRTLGYLVIAVSLTGCASYYMVRDPTTGTRYYTDDIDDPGRSGSIRFKDARTSREVTLQNSEVVEISRDEFERQTGKYK